MAGLSRGEKLRRVRAQVGLLRQLGEQLEAAKTTLRAVELTGMPKGGGLPCGLDVRLSKKDALERIIRRESAVLRRFEREARAEMDMMKPELYAFSAMYYLGGLSIEEAGEIIGRSKRQCMRYKKEIEGGTEDAEETA